MLPVWPRWWDRDVIRPDMTHDRTDERRICPMRSGPTSSRCFRAPRDGRLERHDWHDIVDGRLASPAPGHPASAAHGLCAPEADLRHPRTAEEQARHRHVDDGLLDEVGQAEAAARHRPPGVTDSLLVKAAPPAASLPRQRDGEQRTATSRPVDVAGCAMHLSTVRWAGAAVPRGTTAGNGGGRSAGKASSDGGQSRQARPSCREVHDHGDTAAEHCHRPPFRLFQKIHSLPGTRLQGDSFHG